MTVGGRERGGRRGEGWVGETVYTYVKYILSQPSYQRAVDRGEVKEKKGTDGIWYSVLTTFAVKDETSITRRTGTHGSRPISAEEAQKFSDALDNMGWDMDFDVKTTKDTIFDIIDEMMAYICVYIQTRMHHFEHIMRD